MQTTKIYKTTIVFVLSILISSFSFAQEDNKWSKILKDYKIKAGVGFQVWSTYTVDQEIFDSALGDYVKVDNRLNFELHRSRFSLSGQPYPNLKFNATAAFDFVGRDALAATQGGNNNGPRGEFGLWGFYLRWQPNINSDLLHITGGFMPPQIGRESITAAFKSTSFEKSWSQNILRRFIVGTGPGRTTGIKIGGQKSGNQLLGYSYDVGIYFPKNYTSVANSQGINANPLLTARLAFYIGDPESAKYTTGHKVNYFGNRKGLTIAFAGSHQSTTDIFDKNQTYGIDWLLNLGMLNFDGDWFVMRREKTIGNTLVKTNSNGGYMRMGYNILFNGDQYLEPVIMYVKFNGPLNLDDQTTALDLLSFAGTDQVIDFTLNYHMNEKLKLTVSYTLNSGELGDANGGATFNNYFTDSNGNPIKRGNLFGLGLAAAF